MFFRQVFLQKTEIIQNKKTNVFGGKTHRIVGNYHKNPIIAAKIGENGKPFVKMTKIGIEICNPFVYNVFIAASKPKAA